MDDAKKVRGRLQLILLALVFIAPLVAAIWLYLATEQGAPDEATANGVLIHPARPLGEFTLPGALGHAALDDEKLQGVWTLVYVGGAACDSVCVETLWESRQVRMRLGREADRVQRVYLLSGADAPEDAKFFSSEHPDALIARADDGFLAKFGDPERNPEGQLYVVDPLGNLMLRYPVDAPPKALLDDLKKLLRLSRIG